jgi:hypothetical protein
VSSSKVTLSRDPDDTQQQPAQQPPQQPAQQSTDDVKSLYQTVLHMWNLRSGMGEALNEEEDKIVANEDITPRLAENACAPKALTMQPTPGATSPGLTDESLLFSPGEDAGYELWPVSDDEINLAKAFAYRMVLLLRTFGPDDFADEDDFWEVHKGLTSTACSEEDTIDILGDESLKESWAFPRTWAKRLQTGFLPDYDVTALETFRNNSYSKLNDAAEKIPPYLAKNGLPINFKDSLSLGFLRPAELISILRSNSATANLLSEFFDAEDTALENDQKLSFGRRWLGLGNEIVAAVGAAQKSVNPASYDGYWRKISVESLMDDRKGNNEFEANNLRLNLLEQDISNMAYVWSLVRRWLQKRLVDGVLDTQFDLADGLIRALDSGPRLDRAQDWRSAKDFDSAARDFLMESFDIGDVAVGVGKDLLLDFAVGALFGPIGLLIKEAGQAAYSLNESREKISAARDAARNAKSVTELQNASANLALVMAAEGLSIALTLAQVPGLLKQAKNLRAPKGVHVDDESALKKTTPDEPSVKKPTADEPGAKPSVDDTAAKTTTPSDTPTAPKEPDVPPPKRIPTVESEADFLARTRGMHTKMSSQDAQRELALARTRGQHHVAKEPYTSDVTFNDHTWRYNKKTGKWCRFGSVDCYDGVGDPPQPDPKPAAQPTGETKAETDPSKPADPAAKKQFTKKEFDQLSGDERNAYLTQWMKDHDIHRLEVVNDHHAWPKYLGGPEAGPLIGLDEQLHQLFHAGLDKLLPRNKGTAYYAAFSDAEKLKNIKILKDYARSFDIDYKSRIYETLMKALKGTPYE